MKCCKNEYHTLGCNSKIQYIPSFYYLFIQLCNSYMGFEGVEAGVALPSFITCDKLEEFVPPIPVAPVLVSIHLLLLRVGNAST